MEEKDGNEIVSKEEKLMRDMLSIVSTSVPTPATVSSPPSSPPLSPLASPTSRERREEKRERKLRKEEEKAEKKSKKKKDGSEVEDSDKKRKVKGKVKPPSSSASRPLSPSPSSFSPSSPSPSSPSPSSPSGSLSPRTAMRTHGSFGEDSKKHMGKVESLRFLIGKKKKDHTEEQESPSAYGDFPSLLFVEFLQIIFVKDFLLMYVMCFGWLASENVLNLFASFF